MCKIIIFLFLYYFFFFSGKPGMFDFKGKAKWEAWNGKKGVSQSEAKESYVEKVKSLIASYGLKL